MRRARHAGRGRPYRRIEPERQFKRELGLRCEHGIVVGPRSRTADPDIVAAAIASPRRTNQHAAPLFGVRAERHRTGAVRRGGADGHREAHPGSAVVLVGSVCRQPSGHRRVAGYDHVVLCGAVENYGFSAFYFRHGKSIAADSVDLIKDHVVARKVLDRGLDLTPEHAADVGFDLSSLVKEPRRTNAWRRRAASVLVVQGAIGSVAMSDNTGTRQSAASRPRLPTKGTGRSYLRRRGMKNEQHTSLPRDVDHAKLRTAF